MHSGVRTVTLTERAWESSRKTSLRPRGPSNFFKWVNEFPPKHFLHFLQDWFTQSLMGSDLTEAC